MKFKKLFIVMVVLALVCPIHSFQNAQDHKVLFEKAQYTMESKGDLEEAIELYEKFIAQYPGEKEYAARAQFLIGLCYEKLGQKEAQIAYQKVIDNYPKQVDAVNAAKEKLSLLFRTQRTTKKGAEELTLRKVWETRFNDPLGAPSPDGRYIPCYGNNGSGDLAVCELSTGHVQVLTEGASWATPFAMSPVFSPDGKKIAYAWTNQDDSADIWMINTDGSGNRRLLKSENGQALLPSDWSRDGRRILVYAVVFGGRDEARSVPEIMEVTAESKQLTRIKKIEGLGDICYSPDGKYIAFDKEGDIYSLPSGGGEVTSLVSYPGVDKLLGWAPDGRNVLFSCNRKGGGEIWAVPVEDGRSLDEARLIKFEIGSIAPLGFAEDGSFYFKKGGWEYDIYEAEINLDERKLLGSQEPTLFKNMGNNVCAAWSDEGKYFGYVRLRESMERKAVLCVRDETTGEERVLHPDLLSFHELYWSPDGLQIATYGRDQEDRPGYFAIDTQSGNAKPIFLYENLPDDKRFCFCQWSSDGRAIFYLCKNSSGIYEIRRRQIDTEKEEIVYRHEQKDVGLDYPNPACSPDRQKMAFVVTQEEIGFQKLMVLSINEKEATEVFSGESPADIGGLVWAPDGRRLLFTQKEDRELETPSGLWMIDLKERIPEKIGELNKFAPRFFSNLQVRPDGKKIICTFSDKNQEVWVMENFNQILKKKK